MKGNATGPCRRLEARFYGRVQGVGFRYTSLSCARGAGVNGFVRNEPDGSVTLVAEGTEKNITNFMKALHSSDVGGYIAEEEKQWLDDCKGYGGFEVR